MIHSSGLLVFAPSYRNVDYESTSDRDSIASEAFRTKECYDS